MLFFHLLFILLINTVTPQTTEIHSPRLTEFGHWYDWMRCPEGMYAAGIQLKVQGDQRGRDDTGLNAVSLYCRELGSDSVSNEYRITSGEGDFGDWQAIKWCPGGTSIVGFQLRSEPDQRGKDDVAADNFAAYCEHAAGDRNSNHWIDGDTPGWGDWTKKQFCLSGFVVCGIRSQVEENQGDGDDTALNNVDLLCCKVQKDECVPSVQLRLIKEIDNRHGAGKSSYEVGYTVSHTKRTGQTVTNSRSDRQSYTAKFMFNLSGTVKKVDASLNSEFGYSRESVSSQDVQSLIEDAVMTEKSEKLNVEVLPYTRVVIKQLTISCNEDLLKLDKTTIVSYS